MSYLDCRTRCLTSLSAALLGFVVLPGTASASCQSGAGNNTTTFPLANAQCQANSGGANDSTAVGAGSDSVGNAASAFGFEAFAAAHNTTAIGAYASADSNGATTVGANTAFYGAGIYATSIGGGLYFDAGEVSSARASGAYAIAIGGGDRADFTPSSGPAIKLNGALATGYISMAIGTASQATGGGSSAIGLGSKASGTDSAAYGEFSEAKGASSIAMGLFSAAGGTASLAFGANARATKTKAIAIGANSVANIANTVSVGSNSIKRRIVNVAPGVAANDVVTVAQLQATVAAAVARASATNAAMPVTLESPLVTGHLVDRYGGDDIRQELAGLRVLVKQQQERIAQLESRVAAETSAK